MEDAGKNQVFQVQSNVFKIYSTVSDSQCWTSFLFLMKRLENYTRKAKQKNQKNRWLKPNNGKPRCISVRRFERLETEGKAGSEHQLQF